MTFEELPLSGLILINSFNSSDERGTFVKNFHKEQLTTKVGNFDFRELFYSESKKNVIRGMHFQRPPHDHAKLVFPMSGSLLDVVVDIRSNSNTYGKYHAQKLDYNENQALFIPTGFAHGFLSLEDNTKMIYCVSKEHSPNYDDGIKWNSFGYNWPCKNPIVSSRDNSFNSFDKILSKSYF